MRGWVGVLFFVGAFDDSCSVFMLNGDGWLAVGILGIYADQTSSEQSNTRSFVGRYLLSLSTWRQNSPLPFTWSGVLASAPPPPHRHAVRAWCLREMGTRGVKSEVPSNPPSFAPSRCQRPVVLAVASRVEAFPRAVLPVSDFWVFGEKVTQVTNAVTTDLGWGFVTHGKERV